MDFYQESAAKHGQQETRSHGGADDARHVRAHGMHEQEVGGVGALALELAATVAGDAIVDLT